MTTTRFDARTSACTVFTWKEGLLSAAAHDLRLRVEAFSVEVEQSDEAIALRGTFDPRSLRVDGVVKNGDIVHGLLGPTDCAKIERSILEDVLHAKTHPEIRFDSTRVTSIGGGYRVEGELELHGVTRELGFDVKLGGDTLVADVPIQQPDFGVRPFSAMLGAMKIKPGVLVRVTLPRARLS